MGLYAVLAWVVALVAIFWVYFSWNFNYWTKRGVAVMQPPLLVR